MSDYPTIIYKIGGVHRAHGGLTYTYKTAHSKSDLTNGWFLSLDDAVKDHESDKKPAVEKENHGDNTSKAPPLHRGRPRKKA